MSASPAAAAASPRDVEMAEATAPSPGASTSAEPQTAVAENAGVEDEADDDDDLFGGGDDEGDANGADDGEEDEDDIRPSARRRQRVVGSASPEASPERQGRTTSGSGLPTFEDDEAIEDDGNLSASGDEAEAARLAALEYPEEGLPMGERDGARSPSPALATRVTSVSLPNTAQRFTPSHLARLPQFLKMDSRPFDEDAYKAERREAIERERAEGDNDEKMQDVERRLRCENTVRWKLGENGQRRSNARFVRWSDGSWTLQVGKEHFDIAGLDTRHAPSGNADSANGAEPSQSQGMSQPMSQSQSQSQSQQPKAGTSVRPPSNTQPLNYLASPDYATGVFQTLSPLYSNISIQPTSTQSATHRLISQNLSSLRARQAAAKVAKSELVVGEKAPEELKREREKKLLDEERKKRLRNKKERGGDIEDEEEAELSGLLRGRRRTLIDSVAKGSKGKTSAGLGGKRGLGRVDEYEEDEGGYMEEDAEGFIVDDEDDDAEGEEDDEEDGDASSRKKKSKGRRSGDMDVDSDEEEGGEEELDAMEQAELRIEKQEAARARAKKEAAAAQGGDEEDGNEPASQRKKKVVIDSDDDE